MADIQATLSFDDILEAVQESRRGRWFLQEYESRLNKRDSQSLLQAMNRLEARMENLGGNSATSGDLSKVRSAIAGARNDLMKLGLGKEAMSAEGRLFANLAELARKALPEKGQGSAVIVRSLQLVDEIDKTVSPAEEDKGAKYFAPDANLFERPAAPQKPVLVSTAETPAEPEKTFAVIPPAPKKEEPGNAGARLVIRKAGEAAPAVEAPVAAAAEPEKPPFAPVKQDDTLQIDNPRIVIIRRKAEDMPEVNVGGEQSAAEASSAA